ncbi:hypothetical protein GLP21_17565 [Photobacterium carnosum]|uniref:Uncharacterized protein n=1 Tax=Photobacterium carnosum TaxID=2023717 RepID=A0A2N4UWH3_9GAMM|nr:MULTISPECIES: hypothetical protein [Photobacterium]MCD9476315.1 hypothetical protein [Photobacterium phosphoreum]MCD9508091.1 hypothetical protein [Photobacterium phosphoreum]MCD9539170.1 hypothetical protein [Photobacterium carnosum]MCD9542334.1 hypothetical protein [Photobacterium carnosum]MCD9546095.1 hypothetical protein [Photobacterium carnosum]
MKENDLELLAKIDSWQLSCAESQKKKNPLTRSNAGEQQWKEHQQALKIHSHFKQCKTSSRILDLPTTALPPLM